MSLGYFFIFGIIELSVWLGVGVGRLLKTKIAQGYFFMEEGQGEEGLLREEKLNEQPPEYDHSRMEKAEFSMLQQRNSECAICEMGFKVGARVGVHRECESGFHLVCLRRWKRSHFSQCPECGMEMQ